MILLLLERFMSQLSTSEKCIENKKTGLGNVEVLPIRIPRPVMSEDVTGTSGCTSAHL